MDFVEPAGTAAAAAGGCCRGRRPAVPSRKSDLPNSGTAAGSLGSKNQSSGGGTAPEPVWAGPGRAGRGAVAGGGENGGRLPPSRSVGMLCLNSGNPPIRTLFKHTSPSMTALPAAVRAERGYASGGSQVNVSRLWRMPNAPRLARWGCVVSVP